MIGLLFVIYIVFISLGLPDSLFGVSWPVIHLEFGLPESFAAPFSAVTGLCTSGVSFVAGKLIRRFGTGKVTLFSILLTVAGMVGICFSCNLWMMMAFSILMGYGAGAIDTGLNNYVSLHYKAHHMNWLHCFWGVGVTASPMIMSAFLGGGDNSWRNGYVAVACIQLAIAMLVLFTLSKWRGESFSQEEKKASNKSFFQLMKYKGLFSSILSLGFYCAGESLIGTWGATYAVNALHLLPETAAKWVSLYYAGIMVSRVVAGFASMKVGDNWLIRGGMLLSALGMGVLVLPVGEMSLLGLFLIGFGYGPVFPSVLHSVPARFGSTYSADITGYHMGSAYFIGLAVQVLFGLVATAVGFGIMPFVLLGVCVLVLLANEWTVKATGVRN